MWLYVEKEIELINSIPIFEQEFESNHLEQN